MGISRLLVLGTLIGAGTIARADTPKLRVAVVPTVAVNLDSTRVDALAQDLADALNAELIVEAIGGIDVRRALKPDLPADCATTPACASEVARATNVQQILFVVMVDTGANGAAQIDATWVDAATGRNASRPGVSLSSTVDTDAKSKFRESATLLLPDAPARPKPKPQGAVSIDGHLVGGRGRHITVPAMATAGVAVVGIGATIAFGLGARNRFDACKAMANTCTQDQKDSVSHWALASDFSWGIAAAAVITTGVIYATSAEAPHVIAAPIEGGGAVTYFGSF
jgi:hypothetical protein